MNAKYDSIGSNYSELRKPDPRIAALIKNALGTAETILNVGAGTGSYEPTDRQVTAVEPSLQMIRRRGAKAARVIQGCAEQLPFGDDSFDASMAILTVHHWPNKARGLREMHRVPHDCTDRFLHAYWRRPAAYLDTRIRSGSSSFWSIGYRLIIAS